MHKGQYANLCKCESICTFILLYILGWLSERNLSILFSFLFSSYSFSLLAFPPSSTYYKKKNRQQDWPTYVRNNITYLFHFIFESTLGQTHMGILKMWCSSLLRVCFLGNLKRLSKTHWLLLIRAQIIAAVSGVNSQYILEPFQLSSTLRQEAQQNSICAGSKTNVS